jgi:hypothetical protein
MSNYRDTETNTARKQRGSKKQQRHLKKGRKTWKSITEIINSERQKPRTTFVGKPIGKRAFRRPRYSFQENNEIDPNQTGREIVLDGSLCAPVGGFWEHAEKPAESIRKDEEIFWPAKRM